MRVGRGLLGFVLGAVLFGNIAGGFLGALMHLSPETEKMLLGACGLFFGFLTAWLLGRDPKPPGPRVGS